MSAHYMAPDDEGRKGYYREFLTCSDGRIVTGAGLTAAEAEQDAAKKAQIHEAFLRLSPAERLKVIVAGDLLDSDQRTAIRLLAELVLDLAIRRDDAPTKCCSGETLLEQIVNRATHKHPFIDDGPVHANPVEALKATRNFIDAEHTKVGESIRPVAQSPCCGSEVKGHVCGLPDTYNPH